MFHIIIVTVHFIVNYINLLASCNLTSVKCNPCIRPGLKLSQFNCKS